ncbi:hypothetical protein RvY_13236, partial [Ramazzottius varieornatus]
LPTQTGEYTTWDNNLDYLICPRPFYNALFTVQFLVGYGATWPDILHPSDRDEMVNSGSYSQQLESDFQQWTFGCRFSGKPFIRAHANMNQTIRQHVGQTDAFAFFLFKGYRRLL